MCECVQKYKQRDERKKKSIEEKVAVAVFSVVFHQLSSNLKVKNRQAVVFKRL
jgi:hypothetical protein